MNAPINPAPILFLEFDGCLHRYGSYITDAGPVGRGPRCSTLFEYVFVLEDLMVAHDEFRVVLTTEWVRHFGYAWTKARLPSTVLRQRIVGATNWSLSPLPGLLGITRGREILEYAERNGVTEWIALDARDDGFSDCRERLVLCDEAVGIYDSAVHAELDNKLRAVEFHNPVAQCANPLSEAPRWRVGRHAPGPVCEADPPRTP